MYFCVLLVKGGGEQVRWPRTKVARLACFDVCLSESGGDGRGRYHNMLSVGVKMLCSGAIFLSLWFVLVVVMCVACFFCVPFPLRLARTEAKKKKRRRRGVESSSLATLRSDVANSLAKRVVLVACCRCLLDELVMNLACAGRCAGGRCVRKAGEGGWLAGGKRGHPRRLLDFRGAAAALCSRQAVPCSHTSVNTADVAWLIGFLVVWEDAHPLSVARQSRETRGTFECCCPNGRCTIVNQEELCVA